MPVALAVVAPVLSVPVAELKPVRVSRAGRECPVCASAPCSSPLDCAAEFSAHVWVACADCAGTGWDSTGMAIWCRVCGGSKIVEG
ncbi:hypothetical protein [Streptacidiphilus cavernicola]|uniref:Uncharacterized protein n=1 Tax=Streptacidiphilus cavernicola TaxID=3342716 RepID=A0ABV6VU93_9ACTN